MSSERSNEAAVNEPRPSGWTERADGWVQKGEEWAIFGLLALLVLMTFVQVVLRNLPGNPSVVWIDLASRLIVLWVGLFGASLAVARKKHISIDVASRLLPEGMLRWTRGLTGAFSLVVMLALVHASLAFTVAKHKAASLPLFTIDALDLSVYEWFFTDLVPVIFIVMLWHGWVRWREDIVPNWGGRHTAAVVGVCLLVGLVSIYVFDIVVAANPQTVAPASASLWEAGNLLKSFPLIFVLLSAILALLGAPLFVVIAAIALIGHYAVEQIPVQNFVADGIGGFRKSTIFLAIPLFTLAGYLMAEGNTPKRLVGLFRGFLGWMPGGVAIVALIACSFFTAFTGASGVTIIALGGLLYPILREDRYPEKFTLGLLTTGGSRGLIFPPAIPVFLLAMIMGLSWDAVTATGPFGSAVMEPAQRQELYRAGIEARRAELALDEELSAGDADMDADIDRLLEQRLNKGAEPGSAPAAVGRDEFELGDDGNLDEGADEFELGDDENIEESGGDEFELGDDDNIEVEADEGGRDEFELGDDDNIETAPEDEERDEFELGDDDNIGVGAGVALVIDSDADSGGADPPPVDTPELGAGAVITVPSSTQIFTAGLIPGLLMVFAIAAYCIIMGFRSRVLRTKFSVRRAGKSLVSARWELPIPILIGVGIFGGFFTPAEAASATAAYAIFMQLVLYRDFGLKTLKKTFVDSMVLVGGILIILVAAMGLLNFLVLAKVPDLVLSMIENIVPERLPVLGLFEIPRQITFLLMLNLFLLVVGCLMDIFSAILVVLPLLLPIAYRFGIHPAHLAVIFLTNLEIGYSTPPVGINLFVASLRFDKPVVKLYAASLAFLAIMFAGLLVITYWPGLSMWLVDVTGVQ